MRDLFYLQNDNVYALPTIHYNMETAALVTELFYHLKPSCVAVEFAETMQRELLQAASRLPDISIVMIGTEAPLYYMVEPCDASFEAIRCALENQIPAFCIDLDVNDYPEIKSLLPDPYAIYRIGLRKYYEAYSKEYFKNTNSLLPLDNQRELYMARRLKELSFMYDTILFVGGMLHVERVLKLMSNNVFPQQKHATRDSITVNALTEESNRNLLAEYGWISSHFESNRQLFIEQSNTFTIPNRQLLLYQLYKEASYHYNEDTGNAFNSAHMHTMMKFSRNLAILKSCLQPNLFQLLTAAKCCVDHNYAYEVWLLATEYPYRKNIDNLPELNLSIEEVWGDNKLIHFHLREKGRKGFTFNEIKQKKTFKFHFSPFFTMCSYQPEDVVIENFGSYLKKKGVQILSEEQSKTIQFTTSIEEGIDIKETIRNWHSHKLYVKVKGKPVGQTSSVVIIFDDDISEDKDYKEKFPWKMTWLGEHDQESDMAFYATPITERIVGPGISRCEYGGLMLTYPPKRLADVWTDPDYSFCATKPEVLITAAIDYAINDIIVYVGPHPPRSIYKSFARRFGKKIVYIPIGQISSVLINKIRVFHVLDGHDKRDIADEYI